MFVIEETKICYQCGGEFPISVDEIDPETQTSTAEHMEQGDDILSMIQEA